MSSNHNDERIGVVWFENKAGYVIVAPDHSHPTPQGFERKECRTLHEIDVLTKRLNRQDTDMFSRLMENDRRQMRAKHEQIRSKLGQRLLAVNCSNVERLFILRHFRYMDQKEKEILKCEVNGYFHQREYDSPGSDPIDRHGKQLEATTPKLSDRLASLMTK